jgi:VIT1/CCC1 family predicted Fe2+/Mn2+ transporter
MARQARSHPAAAMPASGLRVTIGNYLPDLIFGANDGVITTLAVIAGVVGASLSPMIVLILGFANLLADGFSMGASNVLSRRSGGQGDEIPTFAAASRHGVATFMGFIGAGIVPLLGYLLPWFGDRFLAATVLGLATLFAVGASRAFFINRGWFVSGLEMLLLGALAAAVAYGVGALGAFLIGKADI